MNELTKTEKAIITKYDLYFEGRLSKLEMLTELMHKDMIEIKRTMRQDFSWILGAIILIFGTLAGIMAHGFKWF